MRLLFLALSLCIISCSSTSDKPRKTIHQVRCKFRLQKCHVKAGQRCARGYSVRSSVRTNQTGGPWGAYRGYIMKFTCDDWS